MALIDDVKRRLGINYTEENKEAEIAQMISAAQEYFAGAGWDTTSASPLVVEAIALFCKMAQSTDPASLTNHPVLLSYIIQGRTVAADDD
ncbi:hypothetical protein JR334_02010 [Clostridia bacterium]|nr:hypothetical protein JR334_02010 [Clostridia bacterium]